VIAVTPEMYEDNLLMFYEKQFTPESPKQIWMRKISEPMGEETVFLADDTVVYRNPKVYGFSWLIFESNPDGNFDLFAIEFDESGNPAEMKQLTNTPDDESSFFIADRYANTGCWESEGRIIIAEIYGDEPEIYLTDTLDADNCHDPVCSYYYAAWRRIENNETYIFFSEKLWPPQWSDPDTIMATGNNINLKIADENCSQPLHFCWENGDSVLFRDISSDPEIVSPHFPGINSYHQPAAFNLWVITDYFPELYSFVGNTDDQDDIYLADGMFGTDPLNLSCDQKINSNPVMYGGRNDPWFTEVINIWKTQFNGFEALYKSDAWYQAYYSIQDNSINTSRLSLKISPDPFQSDLKFQIFLPDNSPASLNIFDISGNLIKTIELPVGCSGSLSINWNPLRDGFILSKGVYFVSLSQGIERVTTKVIFSGN
jgi:hypothetical protein